MLRASGEEQHTHAVATAPSADIRDGWRRFRAAYGKHRAAEGRGTGGEEELLALPYLATGPFAREWGVRARTFDRFVTAVLQVRAREVASRPLSVLDLGAGNGWVCYRVKLLGHQAVALDMRHDGVDGLAAGGAYRRHLPTMFGQVVASFDAIPVAPRRFDIALFNASLHYALDLRRVLEEAAMVVVSGGRIVILDSPFYTGADGGEAMVTEKRRDAARRFGDLADDLCSLPFVEYLTPGRLNEASQSLGLSWRRHRVRYPLWYELRTLLAVLSRRRIPSRFDLWAATVP